LDRRLGGPQSRSESGGEEKNSQPLYVYKLSQYALRFRENFNRLTSEGQVMKDKE